MRILVLSPVDPSTMGGIQSVLTDLTEEWLRGGHSVRVVVTAKHESGSRFLRLRQGLKSVFVGLGGALVSDAVMIVNATMPAMIIWLAFPNKCTMQHHSNYSSLFMHSRSRTLLERVRLTWIRSVPGIVVSPWLARQFPFQTQVISNPIPTMQNDSEPGPAYRQKRADLLFAGRLVKGKGLDVLLEALGHLRDSGFTPTLNVVGDGEDGRAFRALAKRLEVEGQVRWVGYLGREQTVDMMKTAACVVVPSRHESFGLVAMEALAVRAPLVVSDAENLGVQFREVAGIFENGDTRGLAEQILEVLEGRPKSAETGFELVAECNREKVAEQYIDFLGKNSNDWKALKFASHCKRSWTGFSLVRDVR